MVPEPLGLFWLLLAITLISLVLPRQVPQDCSGIGVEDHLIQLQICKKKGIWSQRGSESESGIRSPRVK